VIAPLPMTVQAGYWRAVSEALYQGLEARDASGYAWDPSDGWRQSRTAMHWAAHLECWIDLGGSVNITRDAYLHSASMRFALRFQADDDSISQARMQAAGHDACEYLMRVQLPHGCRVITVGGYTFTGPMPSGYIEAVVSFTIYVPR